MFARPQAQGKSTIVTIQHRMPLICESAVKLCAVNTRRTAPGPVQQVSVDMWHFCSRVQTAAERSPCAEYAGSATPSPHAEL
mmetsp:Transcript_2943/g.6638  ORF Transcript_2943/g.6638 Transcript_2943/m.6638 type:complete len:82 (+) Transcript_2943:79-324(+)|eukprot:6431986-Prymnesium_polylepis.1